MSFRLIDRHQIKLLHDVCGCFRAPPPVDRSEPGYLLWSLVEAISGTPKLYTVGTYTSINSNRSVGSAFSAIFLLQLSCVVQPAG